MHGRKVFEEDIFMCFDRQLVIMAGKFCHMVCFVFSQLYFFLYTILTTYAIKILLKIKTGK